MTEETVFVLLGDKTITLSGGGDGVALHLLLTVPAEATGCILYAQTDTLASPQRPRPTYMDALRAFLHLPRPVRYCAVGTITFRDACPAQAMGPQKESRR